MIKLITGKIEQIVRLIFVNSLTIFNESVIIVEYPKSGGTWLGQLVSDYFEIPFPRNKFPKAKKSVFHSHYLPKFFLTKNKKILWLVRDGRDVSVSYYYHQLIWSDKNKLDPKTVTYTRKNLPLDDYDNIVKNMPSYLEYSYNHKPSKLHHFNFPGNWAEFNEKWFHEYKKNNETIYFVKYEDLLSDTEATLEKLLTSFFNVKVDKNKLKETVFKYSFTNQTNRKQGEEDKKSFLRKGIKGDWKNNFNEESKAKFKEYAGKALVKFGYEEDFNW